jgi:hypothetical protein
MIFRENLVHPARFERAAFAFGGQRSIQLSYGCIGSWFCHQLLPQYLREKPDKSPAIYAARKVLFARVFSISFFDTTPWHQPLDGSTLSN